MSADFRNKLIMKTSRTTYQKAVEDIHDSFLFRISKKTLNRYVITNSANLDITQEPEESPNILLADSTKVRNAKKGHHEVMGVISLDYLTNTPSLTGFSVNVSAREIAAKINLQRYAAFVGDGGLGLRNFYYNGNFQLCHQHAITDISFYLWKDGLSKKERDPLMKRFKAVLYTLQNSTKKYWKDNDTRRLVNRIIKTRKCLRQLAGELSTLEMHPAERYIMDHKNICQRLPGLHW